MYGLLYYISILELQLPIFIFVYTSIELGGVKFSVYIFAYLGQF